MPLRPVLVVSVLVGLVVGWGSSAASGGVPVMLGLPRLDPVTRVVRVGGHRFLLVADLKVTGIARGAKLSVTCDCQRLSGPIRESREATGRVFHGVNWLLSSGLTIDISVTRSAAVGRYLVLAVDAQHHTLVFHAAGCLTRGGKHERCPASAGPQARPPGLTQPDTTTTPTTTATPSPPTTTTPTPPQNPPIRESHPVIQLSAGYSSSCALLPAGRVDCWGENNYGQLGNGTTTNSTRPVAVSGIDNAIAVRTGYVNSCALLSGGEVDCWGENSYGQLGNATTTSSSTPVVVDGINDAIAIGVDTRDACALLADGHIDCWGDGELGQLGNGATSNSSRPVAVTGIEDATAVDTGSLKSCALLAGGTIDCWGANNYGELGNGTAVNSATPVAVSEITDATEIAVGSSPCAVLTTGAVDCWGDNEFGELGNGTTVNSSTPIAVRGISDAVEVAVGIASACVRLTTGHVNCWGSNSEGQLGNGTTTQSTAPVAVHGVGTEATITGVASLAINDGLTACALLSGGGYDCWGNDGGGQFGNGRTGASTYPVFIEGIP